MVTLLVTPGFEGFGERVSFRGIVWEKIKFAIDNNYEKGL